MEDEVGHCPPMEWLSREETKSPMFPMTWRHSRCSLWNAVPRSNECSTRWSKEKKRPSSVSALVRIIVFDRRYFEFDLNRLHRPEDLMQSISASKRKELRVYFAEPIPIPNLFDNPREIDVHQRDPHLILSFAPEVDRWLPKGEKSLAGGSIEEKIWLWECSWNIGEVEWRTFALLHERCVERENLRPRPIESIDPMRDSIQTKFFACLLSDEEELSLTRTVRVNWWVDWVSWSNEFDWIWIVRSVLIGRLTRNPLRYSRKVAWSFNCFSNFAKAERFNGEEEEERADDPKAETEMLDAGTPSRSKHRVTSDEKEWRIYCQWPVEGSLRPADWCVEKVNWSLDPLDSDFPCSTIERRHSSLILQHWEHCSINHWKYSNPFELRWKRDSSIRWHNLVGHE